MCDVIPLLVDSHIVGVGKPIFGRNRDPTVVLASGHFYNWLEVAANYYTSQIAIISMKNQSYCKCMYVATTLTPEIKGIPELNFISHIPVLFSFRNSAIGNGKWR